MERKLNQETSDDYETQRNEKQLRNIKYSINREKKAVSETNAADNVIKAEEMTKTHRVVKYVKHMSSTQHRVVTYLLISKSLTIKKLLQRRGIDKTYNLGDFHVMPTVFKDFSVLQRITNDHPICFGPTFIHTSSTAET